MKKIFITVFVLSTAFVVRSEVAQDNNVYAISGCCLERESTDDAWENSGKSIQQCEVANEEDGDDLFDEKGKIWWDVSC